MDKRRGVDCLFNMKPCVLLLSMIVLVRACQVDNGEFFTIISVQEESAVGSVVGRLNFDSPEQVSSVTVVDSNPYFEFNPSDNTFTVKKRIDIDQGLNTLQLMILECMPTNGPTLEVEVEFELEDVNDFSPVFRPNSSYTFSVSEAAIAGTQLGLIDARDSDIKNSHVIYELQTGPHSSYFELIAITGNKAKLDLKQTLDYETLQMYSLSVIAKDCQSRRNCSESQRTATASVTIIVQDADDLSPEFTMQEYRASIFEDAVQSTNVVQLVAQDQDSLNAPVEYSISGDGSQYFAINSNTGMVSVQDTAGIVRGRQYLIHANAWQEDDSTKRASASLVIKIVATNGNAPQFTEPSYDVTLSEGSPINTTAVTFTVTDRDTNSQLQFMLAETSDDFPFTISFTGWNTADLLVAVPLDYETTEEYSFVIQVSDGEFMTMANVKIAILNDNDHNPEFQEDSYTFSDVWYEDGALVGIVKASDRDAVGVRKPVTYSILPPYDSLFGVDSNGRVTLKAEGTEYKQTNYLINVQAMDKGASPRSTTVSVSISLLLDHVSMLPTTAAVISNITPTGPTKDRITIYVIAGIAGFLLILVALFVMCFLKRKAKKTAKQLQRKKDMEQSGFDTLNTVDTMKSSDSQITHKTQTTIIDQSEDQQSECSLEPDQSGGSIDKEMDNNRNLQSFSYKALSEADKQTMQSVTTGPPNNLSVISDSEQECMEMPQYLSDSNNSNIMGSSSTAPIHHLLTKSSMDSGRSSMREDVSPYMHRIPFQSFKHVKSSSIDETGHYSHDEEIINSSLNRAQRRVMVPTHSNSFNAGYPRCNVANIRATDRPTQRAPVHISHHSINSNYITEAPEGFRTTDLFHSRNHSRTSDYESNTPTPEITGGEMVDYHQYDMPEREHVPRLPQRNSSYSERPWAKSAVSDSLYASITPKSGASMSSIEPAARSETPYSDISTESEETTQTDNASRPQMTIYF